MSESSEETERICRVCGGAMPVGIGCYDRLCIAFRAQAKRIQDLDDELVRGRTDRADLRAKLVELDKKVAGFVARLGGDT